MIDQGETGSVDGGEFTPKLLDCGDPSLLLNMAKITPGTHNKISVTAKVIKCRIDIGQVGALGKLLKALHSAATSNEIGTYSPARSSIS